MVPTRLSVALPGPPFADSTLFRPAIFVLDEPMMGWVRRHYVRSNQLPGEAPR